MSDPFERIRKLEALFSGTEQIGWQAYDLHGNCLMRLPTASGNGLIRRGSGRLIIIRDRRRQKDQMADRQPKPLVRMLMEAATPEAIDVVQIDEAIYDWGEGRKILGERNRQVIAEALSAPDAGFLTYEVSEDGIPSVDLWFGFQVAWTRSFVLTKGTVGCIPVIHQIPRHPPRSPVY